jgi:hypothetical protein
VPQHATTTSFQPGHRGGPGRPPRDVAVPTAHAVRRLARSFSEEALKTLLELMRNPKVHGNVRIKAAQSVLDRGLGLPTQPIDVVVSRVLAKKLCECTIDELRAIEQHLGSRRSTSLRRRRARILAPGARATGAVKTVSAEAGFHSISKISRRSSAQTAQPTFRILHL